MKDDVEPDPMASILFQLKWADEAGAIINSAVLEFRGTAAPESARLTKTNSLQLRPLGKL